MKIAVRADATSEMGIGHLRRCLSLADALRELGAVSHFVIRDDAVARHVMAGRPYAVSWLPACQVDVADDVPHAAWAKVGWERDAEESVAALTGWAPEWMIIDHYAFDGRWHEWVRAALDCAIVAIDDLGDRSMAADVLLDGNAAESHSDKYACRLMRPARALIGAKFALLAPEYRNAPRYVFSPEVRSIGVFMGGTDEEGLSATVVQTLRAVGFDGHLEVVSSAASRHLETLARLCQADGSAKLSVDLPELSAFYARHDLQIGAGGTSCYERCCIGAPTVALAFTANQLAVVPILSKLGAVRSAMIPGIEATHILPGASPLETVVRALLSDPEQRRALAEKSRRYVDGQGAERAALTILANAMVLRPAAIEDAAMLHRWRNDPATRSVSINTGEISYEGHLRWLDMVLASAGRRLLIAAIGTRAVGAIRFDSLGDGAWEVSLYIDPALHGLGLGKRMLLAGEERIGSEDNSAVEIRATVISENLTSLRMFESAGYRGEGGRLVKPLRSREGV